MIYPLRLYKSDLQTSNFSVQLVKIGAKKKVDSIENDYFAQHHPISYKIIKKPNSTPLSWSSLTPHVGS